MSVAVSGTVGTSVNYYLYVDDPTYAGGTKTLVATTNSNVAVQNDGRVLIGAVKVTYVSGTSSGSGSSGGGGGTCVVVDSVLPSHLRAGDVAVGDKLLLADPATLEERLGVASYANVTIAPCVRIRTARGVELDCSTAAPIGVEGGDGVLAPELLGRRIPVRDYGVWRFDEVISVEPLGNREVIHLTVENTFFLAGRTAGRYILHHNMKPPGGL